LPILPAPIGDNPFKSQESRVAERARKREAVLTAAVRMFNERGFHAASLDDVAATLGISKPTIYHYLGNKEQVLLECVARGLEQLNNAVIDARRSPGSGLDRLVGFLCRYAQVTMEDFGRCVIRTGEELLSAEGAALFRSGKSAIDQAMRALIADGIADGSIAPRDVKIMAFTLAGALNWPARWHDPAGPLDAQTAAKLIVDELVAGLAPR